MAKSWSVALLAASSLIGTASSTSMFAFYTGPQKGVQIGMQDPKTGDIWVNGCNSNINGAPLFPTSPHNVLATTNKPKKGGSIAATGWWDSQHVIASIFWHSENGDIVNGYYQCDGETGILVSQGEYVISQTANIPSSDIHPNTGLAVELLGSTAGYRVFYHDKDSQVHSLSYTNKINWNYYGAVSQDPTFGMALASAHSSDNNITVVFPKSAKDIEVSRLNEDGTYHISTFPETIENTPTNNTAPSKIDINPKVPAKFTLPGWNGKPGGLGVAIDSDFTRTVFWIGTDKKLHEAANINFQWQMMPNQSTHAWPLADDANADLAVTYNFDSSEAWVYYVSNNTIIQAYRGSNGTWSNATAVPTSTSIPGSGDSGSDSGSDAGDDDNSSPSTGLSTGAKAGIGIGVSVGAIGVGLLGLLFFLRRRRQRAAAAAAEADKEQPTTNMGEYQAPSEQALYMADGSLAPAYTPQMPYDAHDPSKKTTPDMTMSSMHSSNVVSPLVEMEQPPTIHELPPTNFTYELPADNVERR
ncbi:hypothetical protein CCMA1212_010400 [Trichoderma ghanense]|uniref:Uncharacterized protein n=1 Tax=Trichoderma ghanense TaxID=65468 RepID=A0ABY2GQ24_9HYPO